MQIRTYLSFKGECQSAIELYKEAFKIEKAEVLKASDAPQDPNSPMPPLTESQKNLVMQATLFFGENYIRLSDSFGPINDAESERVSIAVECSEEEVKNAFEVLSKAGKVVMPLMKTFFSPSYGIVVDKFGVKWQLVALQK